MLYHVCVYKVSGKLEFDIEADNDKDAKIDAINRAKKSDSWNESDCSVIAISFPEHDSVVEKPLKKYERS